MYNFLKIKIKSLAEEAKIIRHEERFVKSWKREPGELPNDLYFDLHKHRTKDVCKESRSSNLAYGYLREMPYLRIEEKCYTKPDWKNVERLVTRYGNLSHNEAKFVADNLKEWSELIQ